MELKMPGLRHALDELKKEHGVDTYAEAVTVIESRLYDEARFNQLVRFLRSFRGRVTPDTLRAVLYNRGYRVPSKRIRNILELRKLFRLPAPGNILLGPYMENPIYVLLGTYGPLKRGLVRQRLEKVSKDDPYSILAAGFKHILVKNGRSFDKRWLMILEKGYSYIGRKIQLEEDLKLPIIEYDRGKVLIDVSKIVNDDSVLYRTF